MTISPSKLFSTGLLSLAFLFSNSVFAAPGPITAVIDSPEQAIVQSQVAFDGSRSHGTVTYEWNFNDGTAVETGANVSKNYPDIGEYKVTLTVTDTADGTTAKTNKIITILAANSSTVTKAKFTVSAGPYTTGTPITFTSEEPTAGNNLVTNNNWDFGDLANASLNNKINPNVKTVEFGTAGNTLTTITHQFLRAGTYTVTLANQTHFPDAQDKALTSTYTDSVTVTGPDVGGGVELPETIYDRECSNCHGKRIRQTPGDKTTPYTLVADFGEFSFIGGRGAANSTPSQVDAALIRGAYSISTDGVILMENVNPLTGPNELDGMVTFLASLTANPNPGNLSGEQLFINQCARCHGTGTGAYAGNVIGASAARIKRFIDGDKSVGVMSTIPYTTSSLDKIANFLNTTAPLLKPQTGDGLYVMYCSYCHGVDGSGGPNVHESIINSGVTATVIQSEINKADPTNRNQMGNLGPLLDLSELELIAATLIRSNTSQVPDGDDND